MNHSNERTKQLYKEIDSAVHEHYTKRKKQPPCGKGCASCCSQFFEVSEEEFSLIFEYINQLDQQSKNKIQKRADALYTLFKEHWPEFYESYFTNETISKNTDAYYDSEERFSITLPCVFLSDEGGCEIYDVRPLICRTTGVGFQHLINRGPVCNYIKHGLLTPLWQADLRPFVERIESIRWIENENAAESDYKRLYPLLQYVIDTI